MNMPDPVPYPYENASRTGVRILSIVNNFDFDLSSTQNMLIFGLRSSSPFFNWAYCLKIIVSIRTQTGLPMESSTSHVHDTDLKGVLHP